MANGEPGNSTETSEGSDPTLMMPGERQGPLARAAGGRPPRWYEKRSGAVLAGSLVGLFGAALVAVFLILTVDSKDEASAGEDDETPTVEATSTTEGGETQAPAGPADFGGTWTTNFARVEMTQQGNSVTGQYFRFLDDNSPRTLQGTLTDRTLDGTFDGQNPLRFQMANDGRSFTGHWADPQGGLHEWCGSLEEPLPDGCGYSGEWKVKGFPAAADLEGDAILMSQYGDSVKMRFDSGDHGEVEFDLAFDGATLARATGTVPLGQVAVVFQLLVTEDPDWRTLQGSWMTPSQRGSWCAAQEDAALPC